MKRIRTLAIGALLAGVPILLSACAIRAQEGPGMEAWGITAVPGIELGHHTLTERPTGCTVILARSGAVGGVDVRGSAPGSREIALLDPVNMVDQVHAVVLSGGSAFGLDAASGVMQYLEERDIGWPVGRGKVVPIVHLIAPVVLQGNVGGQNPKTPFSGWKAKLVGGYADEAGRWRMNHRYGPRIPGTISAPYRFGHALGN